MKKPIEVGMRVQFEVAGDRGVTTYYRGRILEVIAGGHGFNVQAEGLQFRITRRQITKVWRKKEKPLRAEGLTWIYGCDVGGDPRYPTVGLDLADKLRPLIGKRTKITVEVLE